MLLWGQSTLELVNSKLLKFFLFIQQLEELSFFLALEMKLICLLHIVDSLAESRVPVIFDGVVGSAHQCLGDERPLFFLLVAKDKKNPLFFDGPLRSFDFWVKMIEPPLSARFSTSTVQILL